MCDITWDRYIKNLIRSETFSVFKNMRVSAFVDLMGVGCMSTIEALKNRAITKKTILAGSEKNLATWATINIKMGDLGFKHAHIRHGDVFNTEYSDAYPIGLLNLDLMDQFSERTMNYIMNFPFEKNAGFAITVHHHKTRTKSRFLEVADSFYMDKIFPECFGGITEKIRPGKFKGSVSRVAQHNDQSVNTIYGLIKNVSLCQYDFDVKKIMIYSDHIHLPNNMVTFVFNNIRLKRNPRSRASYKSYATKVTKHIRTMIRFPNGITRISPNLSHLYTPTKEYNNAK